MTDQLKVAHAYTLAYASCSTPLGQGFSRRFASEAIRQGTVVPDLTLAEWCNECGRVSVPGITTTLRVIWTGRGRTTRTLRRQCVCGATSHLVLPVQKKQPVVEKPKTKRKKRNDLASLLQEKKLAPKTLDLMEFMK